MEVKTKTSVETITITLTPRDFSSVKSVVALNDRITAIFNEMIPANVKAEYGEWCKKNIMEQVEQQMAQQMAQQSDSNNREEKSEEKEDDSSVIKVAARDKYYNAVFQHISWEHAQQLLTLAKQLNIEFGQIKPE